MYTVTILVAHLLVLYGRQKHFWVEARDCDQSSPVVQGTELDRGQAVDVEERQQAQRGVFRTDLQERSVEEKKMHSEISK